MNFINHDDPYDYNTTADFKQPILYEMISSQANTSFENEVIHFSEDIKMKRKTHVLWSTRFLQSRSITQEILQVHYYLFDRFLQKVVQHELQTVYDLDWSFVSYSCMVLSSKLHAVSDAISMEEILYFENKVHRLNKLVKTEAIVLKEIQWKVPPIPLDTTNLLFQLLSRTNYQQDLLSSRSSYNSALHDAIEEVYILNFHFNNDFSVKHLHPFALGTAAVISSLEHLSYGNTDIQKMQKILNAFLQQNNFFSKREQIQKSIFLMERYQRTKRALTRSNMKESHSLQAKRKHHDNDVAKELLVQTLMKLDSPSTITKIFKEIGNRSSLSQLKIRKILVASVNTFKRSEDRKFWSLTTTKRKKTTQGKKRR